MQHQLLSMSPCSSRCFQSSPRSRSMRDRLLLTVNQVRSSWNLLHFQNKGRNTNNKSWRWRKWHRIGRLSNRILRWGQPGPRSKMVRTDITSKNKSKYCSRVTIAPTRETMSLISIFWIWRTRYNRIRSGSEMSCSKSRMSKQMGNHCRRIKIKWMRWAWMLTWKISWSTTSSRWMIILAITAVWSNMIDNFKLCSRTCTRTIKTIPATLLRKANIKPNKRKTWNANNLNMTKMCNQSKVNYCSKAHSWGLQIRKEGRRKYQARLAPWMEIEILAIAGPKAKWIDSQAVKLTLKTYKLISMEWWDISSLWTRR